MKLASGRLLSESRRGVFGATVEIFSGDFVRESVITNRNGEFSFHAEEKNDQAKLFVRALDRNGKTLAAAQPAARQVEWTIDPGQLANAALPPQATGRRTIDRAVFDTIDLAIHVSFAPGQVARAQAILQAIDCALPAIDRFDDLLDVADGVLRGHSDDMRAFADRLDDMELWNQRNNPAPRRRLNEKQAKALLTKKFLEDYSAKIHAARGPRTRDGILGKRDGIVLLVAAIRTAGGDARRIHRNLGILADQFCGLRGLDRLFGAAFGALAGGLAERLRFVDALLLLGGICELGGFPSREPSPPPCGSPSWPVDADDPEIPGDFPIPVEDCTAEALLAVREALGRQITYTITGITPATGACSGSIITITGTNLTFEGNVPDVLFSGRPRGTQIRATPAFASDTEIRVVVPPGAACGDLELDVPGGAASVFACDTTIELFSGPETPFHFSGGRTTIEFFTPSTTQDCLDAGRELVFSWRVCNAERVVLRIRTEDGDVLLHETVVGHSFVFTVPELDRDTRVTATLLAAGPCGRDAESLAFTFHRGTPFGLDEAVPFTPVPFVNWHGNVRRGRIGIAVPSTLAQLVASVRTAELFGTRVGVQGSLWSYTDCVAPRRTTPLMVDIRLLGAALTNVFPAARRAAVRSVLSSEVLANFPMIRDTVDRLVHVEAGSKSTR